EERRVAFAECDRLLGGHERQEWTVAPHAVPSTELGAVDQREHAQGVADEPWHAAAVADRRETLGAAPRPAGGALERPVGPGSGRRHVVLFKWERMRSARRVERPGNVASSATDADFTPARLP